MKFRTFDGINETVPGRIMLSENPTGQDMTLPTGFGTGQDGYQSKSLVFSHPEWDYILEQVGDPEVYFCR